MNYFDNLGYTDTMNDTVFSKCTSS